MGRICAPPANPISLPNPPCLRLVGHSGFLTVLEEEAPARRELLRLLVLLLSAGGAMVTGGESEPASAAAAAARAVGVALVHPLLSIYGVSMSEDDQVFAVVSGRLLLLSICALSSMCAVDRPGSIGNRGKALLRCHCYRGRSPCTCRCRTVPTPEAASFPRALRIVLTAAPYHPNRALLLHVSKLIVRLLRLLQASGVPLDPSTCRWGAAAIATAAAAVTPTPPTETAAITAPVPPRAGCDWLVGALEPRRLRASIESFPIARELEPPPFPFEAAVAPAGVDGGGFGGGGAGAGKTGAGGSGRRRRRRKGDPDDDSDVSSSGSGSESDSGGSDSGGTSGDDEEEEADDDDGRGGGGGGEDGSLELAVPAAAAPLDGTAGAGQQADQVYDPCFVLPLLEWGLRSAVVKAQSVR